MNTKMYYLDLNEEKKISKLRKLHSNIIVNTNINFNEFEKLCSNIKQIDNEDSICVLCKKSCKENSNCSDRYDKFQCSFENDRMDKENIEDNIYVISICRICYDKYDIENNEYLFFNCGLLFSIDSYSCANY